MHRLSGCGSEAQLLCDMGNPPRPRVNQGPLNYQLTPNHWTTREGPSFKRTEFRVNLQAPIEIHHEKGAGDLQEGEIRGSDVDVGIICI